MSFYRTVDRHMNADERLLECGAVARALFRYLCANSHDDLCGLYRISLGAMEDDTAYERDQIVDALDELRAVGLAHYDPKVRVMWVVNMLWKQASRNNAGEIAETHIAHTRKQIESLPRTPLKAKMVAYYSDRHGVEIGWVDPDPLQHRGGHHSPPEGSGEKPAPLCSYSVSSSDSVSGSKRAHEQSKPRTPKPKAQDELVEAVLAKMREAVQDVTRGRDRGPQDRKGNRKLIRDCTRREGATLDDWLHVIEAQRESVRDNPEAWRYLALSTICRPQNWLRLLDAPRSRGSPRRGSIEPSTQNHDAEVPF